MQMFLNTLNIDINAHNKSTEDGHFGITTLLTIEEYFHHTQEYPTILLIITKT